MRKVINCHKENNPVINKKLREVSVIMKVVYHSQKKEFTLNDIRM